MNKNKFYLWEWTIWQGEGSGVKGGEVGIGYPPVHPLYIIKYLIYIIE